MTRKSIAVDQDEAEVVDVVERKKNPLPVHGIQDLITAGVGIAQSGMFGPCTTERGFVIASICLQEGISLLDFMRSYHLTKDGKITMRSDRMLAEFQRLGGKCVWGKCDEKEAAATFSYKENVNVVVKFSIEEAKKAGYVRDKSAWTTDPGAMLRARVITRGVKMVCPQATAGMYTPEEMADVYSSTTVESYTPTEQYQPLPAPTPEPAKQPEPPQPQPAPQQIQTAPPPQQNPAPQTAPQPTQPKAPLINKASDGLPSPWDTKSVDFSVCPVDGKMYGVKWADMPIETLHAAMNLQHNAMTPGHFEAINQAIAAKQ